MREIEVKIHVESLERAVVALKSQNVTLGAPNEQHDVVYCRPEDSDKPGQAGINWLRLRTENKTRKILTLKQTVQGDLDSIEIESEVEDTAAVARMLEYMGYALYNDLTKIRRKAMWGDIEVCVDEVPPLGTFIELERMCEEDADNASVEAELMQKVESLGIDYERINQGYDTLMNNYLATHSAK